MTTDCSPVVYVVSRERNGYLEFLAPAVRRQWTAALWEARFFPTHTEADAATPQAHNVYPLILSPAEHYNPLDMKED